MLNIKLYIIIAASSLGLMIAGSIVGGLIAPRGHTADPQVEKIMLLIYGFLFLALAFAAVPIVLRVFTTLQIKIGNGDLPPIQWIRSHESIIAYGVWGMCLLGLIIALPAILKGLFAK
jgi:hypothetical protein